MSNNDISDELKAIADNFESKNYGVVVQQALLLIEKKLCEVIKRDFTQLDSATQSKIHNYLSPLNKSIDKLTMGQIVGLLRATKFFDAWKQQFNKELRVFETIDLNKLVDLRNETAHGTRTTPFTREEAELIVCYQKLIFQMFGDSSSEKPMVKSKSIWKELKFIIIITGSILGIYLSILPKEISDYFGKFMSLKIFPTQTFPNSTPQENTPKKVQDKTTTIQPKFCDSVTTIPREECETLANLYYSTDRGSRLSQEGWLHTDNPCNFTGIICENKRVVQFWLSSKQLSGKIPDLSQLKNLRILTFSNNQLSGTIPDLSQLKNLVWINISDNQLSGKIPSLSQLENLKWFNISNNQLNGTIPDLSQLKNLNELNLSDNQLSGTIPDLSPLKNLARLNLSNNRLSGTIPDLSQLKNLNEFNLSDNQLCRSPKIQYPEKWQTEINQYPLCTSNQ